MDEFNKDFDKWNKVKKQLNSNEDNVNFYPKEGQVWFCSVGVNIGYEQDGTGRIFERPVLVVKKFNNKMYWVVPLSTKHKQYDFYFNFVDPNGQKASAILAQLRLLSIRRFIRDMYMISDDIFEGILVKLRNFINKSKPRF
ncbi:MAG: type II toxin-antitoxin system PemK/MazF family toxin [Candidatus Yanofskybacteria bacterium]|nr:type II toxin-antitoxin system PemK/MazF family toxin [Candidatus Yanofskybacteria bacterium]